MKKLFYSALAVAGSASAALAQEGSASAINIAETLTEQAKDSLTGMLDTVAPVIVAVVVAGLSIWGGIALVGIIKRGFTAGKGR